MKAVVIVNTITIKHIATEEYAASRRVIIEPTVINSVCEDNISSSRDNEHWRVLILGEKWKTDLSPLTITLKSINNAVFGSKPFEYETTIIARLFAAAVAAAASRGSGSEPKPGRPTKMTAKKGSTSWSRTVTHRGELASTAQQCNTMCA